MPSHVAVWQRIADLLLANGQPLSTVEIAERMGIEPHHAKAIMHQYPQVFERIDANSFEGIWSTHQLEAARLRVLYGEKPVVRGVRDVREMVRRAG